MKTFTFLICCLSVMGCTSKVTQLRQNWLGKDRNSLIASKGTPDHVMDDGLGSQIYTYLETKSFTTGETMRIYTSKHGWQNSGPNLPTQTFTNTRKTMFWINSTGKIYRVSVAR